MKKIIIITLLALSASNVAYSEGFNYDYIQAGIGKGSYKSYDREYYVGISKPINNNISVRGSLYYLYGDWNDPGEYEEQSVNAYSLEGTYHKEVTPFTDLLASAGYARSHYKLTCTPTTGTCGTYSDATPDFGHSIVTAGIRHKTRNNIEIEGSYSFVKTTWTSATNTSRQAKVSLIKEVIDNTSVGVEYTWGLTGIGIDHYGVFVRKYF